MTGFFVMRDLDIIVPARNEAGSVEELVSRIVKSFERKKINYGIIFVDDYSTDGTSEKVLEVAQKFHGFNPQIAVLPKKGKQGKAYSILEASRVSTANYLAMVDGDLQYPPEAIPLMYELTGQHGVVVANRKNHKTSFLRKIGSKLNVYLFERLLHGFKVDTQSGLKVFRREVIEHLSEKDVSGWTIDMPLLATALELGYSIGCIDIDFVERKNGHSKVNFIKTAYEIGLGALKLKFRRKKIYPIFGERKDSPLGAGVAHRGHRFITHTYLPHEKSAFSTFASWQKVGLLGLVTIATTGLLVDAVVTAIALIGVLTLVYFLDFLFNLYILLKSLHFPPEIKVKEAEIGELHNRELPIYTILCPLYREARILPHFVEAINTLDWPKEKLDVILLLEEDDKDTISAAKDLDLSDYFRVLIVPHSLPKTKPKACNYGLTHAKGELVVIYDAEDRPDPLQLKKAYIGFKKSPSTIVCLQSKLNYYNHDQNLLTRLFTAEYSLWFDLVLPGLQSIETTIPLGGTSNHFKADKLRELQGWDPFNVTEDCDLGARLYKEGYKTGILDSVTMEEANSKLLGWIRQRSRWIKGYFQTYLVHMRTPLSFLRTRGIHAFIFQLVIGMRMVFILVNPILWITTLSYFIFYPIVGPTIEALYPAPIFYMAVFSLVLGNFMHLYNYMIGAAKRRVWGVIKYVYLVPVYWLMTSVAAGIALYQLFTKPHYWEKTSHGHHLDRQDRERLREERRMSAEAARQEQIEKVRGWARGSLVGGGALVVSAMAANFANFLYNAYLGRNIDLAEFGTVSLISSILSVTSIFTGSFGKTIVYKTAYLLGKFKNPTVEFLEKVEKWGWTLSFLLTFSWVGLTPFLAKYFNADIFPFLLFTPALTIGFISSVYSGYLSGALKFWLVALLTFIESVTKLGFAVAFVEVNLTPLVYTVIPISSFITFLVS